MTQPVLNPVSKSASDHHWVLLLSLTAVLLGSGCTEMFEPACVSGTEVEVAGERFCVAEQPVVVETGFDCPPDMPFMHEVDGISVCSSSSEVPADLLGDLLPYEPPPPDNGGAASINGGDSIDPSTPVESASVSFSDSSTGSSESDDEHPEDEDEHEIEDEHEDEHPEDEPEDEDEPEEAPEESDDHPGL